MSSKESLNNSLNQQVAQSLQIVLPVIYIIVALLGLFGNLIVLQIICANRFRHKSIHLLISSLAMADFFFIIIFTIVRSVSYGYLHVNWFINVNDWCKAEMYLLRLFEFVLAYTVVFLCLDRAVSMGSCWFGVRKFRSGISIVISIWIASAYVLIPILLFKQTIYVEKYGGYLCYSTDESVPLFWLGNFPRRILDFIDIIFRIIFPIFLMIVLLSIALSNSDSRSKPLQLNLSSNTQNNTSRLNYDANASNNLMNNNFNLSTSSILKNKNNKLLKNDFQDYNKRLLIMALGYSIVFAFCQLPYEIYRCVMLWHPALETDLWNRGLDFAIEIPLLILKLINRCANPFLFICLADINGLRRGFFRCWLCPCLPGCIGCNQCWCKDCSNSIKYEYNHCMGNNDDVNENEWIPTGLQTISTHQYRDGERLVTKHSILEEYETGVQPYYKQPRVNHGVVNETFEPEDNLRFINFGVNHPHEENLRQKL